MSKQHPWMPRGEGECAAGGGLDRHHFTPADYAVFGAILCISVSAGVFQGCFRGRKTTASEYLMGDRKMHFFPVGISLIIGFSTAISVLGNPVEMYNYGGQLYIFSTAFFIAGPMTTALYIPVYDRLGITSVNEMMSNALTLYAPALALAEVTNLNIYVILSIVFGVCVFYVSIGGIKAVIWSDVVLFVVLVGTLAALIVRGTILGGGLEQVWNDNLATGRLQLLDFNPDPTVRHTFVSVLIGGTFYWTGIMAANQSAVQRLLTLPSNKEATKCIWLSAVGNVFITGVLFYIGMMIYSSYKDCDPMSAKMVERSDQLLPLYVMDVMGDYPGLPGLFVACVFSTSIGDTATMLNGMTAITLRDFVFGLLHKDLTETQAGTLSKYISFGYGITSFAFVFLVSHVGGVIQTNLSMNGLIIGIALGEFVLGMFFPWANWKGALGGSVMSIAFMMWLSWSTQVAVGDGRIVYETKPISVLGCPCNATIETPLVSNEEVFPLLKLSYMWYAPLGLILFLVISMVISGMTGFQDPRELDQRLTSPLAHRIFNKLPDSMRNFLKLPVYGLNDNGKQL
ncbi:sodium-coupled monocarboxylate transporter 1-like [Hetaerina americana]|uniref:sodium-coupled monocarboxylate transporter 1-like n=1 Tax=Hetaerina americana TaxID=62018 RepID=UPI003A7F4457